MSVFCFNFPQSIALSVVLWNLQRSYRAAAFILHGLAALLTAIIFHESQECRCECSLLFSWSCHLFLPLPSYPLPSINIYLSNMSLALHPPPTSLWCGPVEACRECTISTGYIFSVSFHLSFLYFTSVQTGGALLNRLIVSEGFTSQSRPLGDCLQKVSWESPVYRTLSHDPFLFQSAAVQLAPDLKHTHPHTPWHKLTDFFLTKLHGIYIFF